MTKKFNIAFVPGDTYCTELVAKYLAIKHKDCFSKISVLAQHPERVKDLEKFGIHVCEVDYNSVESVEKGLSDVDHVLLSTSDDDNRVEQACKWVKAIGNAKVEKTLMLSCFTADGKTDRQKSYREIEQVVEKLDKNLIVRLGFVHEGFFLWTKSIKEESKFKVSLNSDSAFAPIALCDIGLAVFKIVTCEYKPESETTGHHILKLTGGEALTPPQIVERINHAINVHVEYEQISREEMKRYFESLRKPSTVTEDGGDFFPRFGEHITEECIQVLLETLDYICEGNASDVTNDLERIVKKKPTNVNEFFKENEKCFKPSK